MGWFCTRMIGRFRYPVSGVAFGSRSIRPRSMADFLDWIHTYHAYVAASNPAFRICYIRSSKRWLWDGFLLDQHRLE